MPYSQRLMTSVFIKRLCERVGAGGDLWFRRRPGYCPTEVVMRSELQQFAFGAPANGRANRAIPCVSTLSLCNANFGRG